MLGLLSVLQTPFLPTDSVTGCFETGNGLWGHSWNVRDNSSISGVLSSGLELKAFSKFSTYLLSELSQMEPTVAWESWCPSFLSVAVIERSDQMLLGKERVFQLTLTYFHPSLREVKAGIWRKKCLLVHSLAACRLICSYLFYIAQDHLLRDSTAHSGLDPAASINNQNNSNTHIHRTSDLGSSFECRLCQVENQS